MNLLQLISIILEASIAFLGYKIATEKRKRYGYFIAITFAIYVVYDIANLYNLEIDTQLLRIIFFVATVSIFYAVFRIYKSK